MPLELSALSCYYWFLPFYKPSPDNHTFAQPRSFIYTKQNENEKKIRNMSSEYVHVTYKLFMRAKKEEKTIDGDNINKGREHPQSFELWQRPKLHGKQDVQLVEEEGSRRCQLRRRKTQTCRRISNDTDETIWETNTCARQSKKEKEKVSNISQTIR